MKIKNLNVAKILFGLLALVGAISPIAAEENIVQQETMSFERCLKVIETSETKLSITPEISEVSEKKRLAVFIVSDGKLVIDCDGKNSTVTVFTEKN